MSVELGPLPEPQQVWYTQGLGPLRAYSAVEMRAYAEAEVLKERERCAQEATEWKIGHMRYEVARRMDPRRWADAWKLNISTGKPFDQIIDELAPFFGIRKG